MAVPTPIRNIHTLATNSGINDDKRSKQHGHDQDSRGQLLLKPFRPPDYTLTTGLSSECLKCKVESHDGTAKQHYAHVKHAHDSSALRPQDSVTGKSGNILGNHLTTPDGEASRPLSLGLSSILRLVLRHTLTSGCSLGVGGASPSLRVTFGPGHRATVNQQTDSRWERARR